MRITEVRIKLMDEPGERLKAFCSITFDDCFVVRDLKIIEGSNGPFVAMPSRKLTSHCPQCGMKNHLRANHCNQCGTKLEENRFIKDDDGRAKLYADIAHPINSACREMIQDRVIDEYDREVELAKQPGYISRYDDFDGGDYLPLAEAQEAVTRRFDKPHQAAATNRPHHPPGSTDTPAGRGPHRPPSAPNESRVESGVESGSTGSGATGSDDGFGAGIFED